MNDKTAKVWASINKNGFVMLWLDEPKRNEETGKWEAKYPYVNSVIYKQFSDFIQKTKLTWLSPPEYFELNY